MCLDAHGKLIRAGCVVSQRESSPDDAMRLLLGPSDPTQCPGQKHCQHVGLQGLTHSPGHWQAVRRFLECETQRRSRTAAFGSGHGRSSRPQDMMSLAY
jgi:hypothetical protein